MGIISLLMTLVVPSITSQSSSGDLTKSTYLVSGALDTARADAMGRNTYRYVALEPATVNGTATLRVKTLGCKTGERYTGASAAPLVPLSRTITLNNLQLASIPDNSPARSDADQNLAKLPLSYQITITGTVASAYLFELAANGEARLLESKPDTTNPTAPPSYSSTLSHWIEIGLLPTHGTAASASGNHAVIQIAGLTGQTVIYRP